ncbi:MAG TPA: hypothetical protein V6D28_29105 [Leptolyngbyaceae cyanobacterium]
MLQVSVKKLSLITLGLLAGTTLAAFSFPQATKAQSLDYDPSQEIQRGDNVGPLNGTGTGQNGFNVFEFMHRANFGQIRSLEEFSAEQTEKLDEEAVEFRNEQNRRLQMQQNPVVPTNSSDTGNTPVN